LLHRPQVDVLIKGKARLEQNADFQDAGLDVGMADGAQKNGVELLELFQRAVGQDLAGALVALAAEIEALVVQLDAVLGASRIQHLDALGQYLGPGAVAWTQRDVVRFQPRATRQRPHCSLERRDVRTSP
jgi:hypothetical protein